MLDTDLLRDDQPFTLRQPRPDLTDDRAFLELRRAHPELRIETDPEGTLIVMSPTGWRSSNRNARITAQLLARAERDGRGEVSDSSGLFRLRGNSRRAPDAAWIRRERLDTLRAGELEGILPIAPDCVIELRSPSDRIEDLLSKMREYIESGVVLAWLIGPLCNVGIAGYITTARRAIPRQRLAGLDRREGEKARKGTRPPLV